MRLSLRIRLGIVIGLLRLRIGIPGGMFGAGVLVFKKYATKAITIKKYNYLNKP